jgi:hypothetical protein
MSVSRLLKKAPVMRRQVRLLDKEVMLSQKEIEVMISAHGGVFDIDAWTRRQQSRGRIPIIIDTIRDLWTEHPEQRLMQLLMNALNIHGDPYEVTDAELLEKLTDKADQTEQSRLAG